MDLVTDSVEDIMGLDMEEDLGTGLVLMEDTLTMALATMEMASGVSAMITTIIMVRILVVSDIMAIMHLASMEIMGMVIIMVISKKKQTYRPIITFNFIKFAEIFNK